MVNLNILSIKILFCILFLVSHINIVSAQSFESELKQTVIQRFSEPQGFQRIKVAEGSFADWLRNLPLKTPGSPVLDFKGCIFKQADDSTVAAVIDLDIQGRRLEQCMDILLRLHSSYFTEIRKQDSLAFPMPDGLMLPWKKWHRGWRPEFKGLHFYLAHKAVTDKSQQNFQSWLNEIYANIGSHTFYHYYKTIPLADFQIGDFIVRKNRKGHAVMILDMAVNPQGQKMVMVGQGDTPACEFYILKNRDGSVWFPVNPNSEYLDLPIKKKMYWEGLRRFPAYTD